MKNFFKMLHISPGAVELPNINTEHSRTSASSLEIRSIPLLVLDVNLGCCSRPDNLDGLFVLHPNVVA